MCWSFVNIGVKPPKVRFNAAYGKVHDAHLPCGRVAFLIIYRDVLQIALMRFNELGGLHKHAAAAAAWTQANISMLYWGLIFLKYISDRFEDRYNELVAEGEGFEED